MGEIILASASPRRHDLFRYMAPDFRIVPADLDEDAITATLRDLNPENIALLLAEAKALTVSEAYPAALTVGVDTLVVLDGEILGKPRDPAHAAAMLAAESDREQTVYSGVALARDGKLLGSGATASTVKMRSLTQAQIDAYVATGEPLDKAGGYGIQDRGDTFVAWYEGDYYNIVGLPLADTAALLRRYAPACAGAVRLPADAARRERVYL
jgi:septum formation protein